MHKLFEKVWFWKGWQIIKWPFGAVLIWLIVSQIYFMEIDYQYDKKVRHNIVEVLKAQVGGLQEIELIDLRSEKIKNLK